MQRILFISLLLLAVGCQKKEQQESTEPASSQEIKPLFVGQQLPFSEKVSTIAIGSCNRQDRPQEMWPFIQQKNPDLWIWLGDNIYGDSEDMRVLYDKYMLQKFGDAYSAFRAEVPVIGIWDDHDYGVNDGGKEYSMRDSSKSLMLDFLDVPRDAEVRHRQGAYQSYTFGPEGQQVKVLLLDTRYFRDSLQRSTEAGRRYVPNEEGTILGEAQWAWLENELRNSQAQVHIIGSSIQVISAEHGYEKWANFPAERQRLFDLLADTKPAHPLLLSGDRHISELSRIDLDRWDQPLYDLTSSGMTHTWSSVGEESNQYRVSDLIAQLAYGLIRIDWSGEEPVVSVEVNGLDGANYLNIQLEN